jgi:hypothetical protein
MPPLDEGNYVAKNAFRDKTLRDKAGQPGASASGLIQVAPDPQLAPRASMLAPAHCPSPFPTARSPALRPTTALRSLAAHRVCSVALTAHCPMIIFANTTENTP